MPDLTPSTFFVFQFGLGVLGGMIVLTWFAARQPTAPIGNWLDAGLGALVGGTIIARIIHVMLNWEYFSQFPGDSWRIWYGGLSWNGAILGGLIGAGLVCRWHGISFWRFADGLALALPVGLIGGWWACRRSGCGYGITLEDTDTTSGWISGYLPDLHGNMELRLELQIWGIWLGVILLLLITVLTLQDGLPELRLWLILFLTGLGMFLVGFLRGDEAEIILNRRLDQYLDAVLMIASAGIGVARWRYSQTLRGSEENA